MGGTPSPVTVKDDQGQEARIANVVGTKFFPAPSVLWRERACVPRAGQGGPVCAGEIIPRRSLTATPPEEGLRPPFPESAGHFLGSGADAHFRNGAPRDHRVRFADKGNAAVCGKRRDRDDERI